MMSPRRTRIGRWPFILVAACALLVFAYRIDDSRRRTEWQHKRQELLTATKRVQLLLDALAAYRSDCGEYPSSLDQLTPRRLTAVPTPGPPFLGEWQYQGISAGASGAQEYELFAAVPHDYDPMVRGWPHFRDCFAYRSDGKYLREDHGGMLERIGAWGYYHE